MIWKTRNQETLRIKHAFLLNPGRSMTVKDISEDLEYPLKLVQQTVTGFYRSRHLKKVGTRGRWALYQLRKDSEEQAKAPIELSALESGLAIIAAIEDLRKRLQAAETERDELKELLSDYDRLAEDNRVMHERITKLLTQLSATNAATLRL